MICLGHAKSVALAATERKETIAAVVLRKTLVTYSETRALL